MRIFFILCSFSILFCLLSCSPEHVIRKDMENFVEEFSQSDSCESVVHDTVFIYNVEGEPNYLLDERVMEWAVSYAMYTLLEEEDDWGILESQRSLSPDSVEMLYREAIGEVKPKEYMIPDEGIWVMHELVYKPSDAVDCEHKYLLYIYDVTGRKKLMETESVFDHTVFEKMLDISGTVYDPEAEWCYYAVMIGYTVMAYFIGGSVLLVVWIKRKKTRKH